MRINVEGRPKRRWLNTIKILWRIKAVEDRDKSMSKTRSAESNNLEASDGEEEKEDIM